jgi:chorismate mutase
MGDFIMEDDFYIVSGEVLSPAMKKTVTVKELLRSGEETQIKQAANRVDLSRSTYYKYRDCIYAFNPEEEQELATLSLLVLDEMGILSNILAEIANHQGNILTINQDLPLDDTAHITVTIELGNLSLKLEELIDRLRQLEGIKKVKIMTKSFKRK